MMMLKGDCRRLLLSSWYAPLLWLLTLQAWGGEIDASNPYRLMQQLAHRTFERIHQEQQHTTHDDNTLRIIVRQELMPFAHIRYTGALILGPLFNTLEAKQQQCYFQALEGYLEQSYTQILKIYQHHDYQIEPEKPFANRTIATVRLTVLKTGSDRLRIDFKWRKNSKNQQWQLYDILVEGVGFIATKQPEWTTLLRRSGFDALIEVLHKDPQQSVTPEKANY